MDDAAIRREATELTADLIRIDTGNPPGNEAPAAHLLRTYLEAAGIECEMAARIGRPPEPGRPDTGHRRRPLARAVRSHRRRAGRRAGVDASAVRGPRRRRRLAVGTRRGRHEEPDGHPRGDDGGARPLRVPAEGRPAVHRAGGRGGRRRGRRHALAGRGTARPARRLRHRRGRRRPAGAGRRTRRRAHRVRARRRRFRSPSPRSAWPGTRRGRSRARTPCRASRS